MDDRLDSVDAVVEKYAVVSSPIKSRIYVGLGSVFVAFAIIGIWVPGWPTVSWAVPAAFLFSLSNEKFDNVVVATGHFSVPFIPEYEGMNSFPGRIMHSHDFRDAEEFRGKDVIVLGSSYSACLLYTSPSPRDRSLSRMPSSA